jgi:hypothetical protein
MARNAVNVNAREGSMRIGSGLFSALLWGATLIVLARAHGSPSPSRSGVWILATIAFAGGWWSAGNAERRDRWFFIGTVVALFGLMLLGIESVLRPGLERLFALLPARWHAREALAAGLAPLPAALLVYALSASLLGYSPADLGLHARFPSRRALLFALVLAVGVWASSIEPPRNGAGQRLLVSLTLASEEFLYRGFLLAVLRDRVGFRLALTVQAGVFAIGPALGGTPDLAMAGWRLALGLLAGGAVRAGGHLGWAFVPRAASLFIRPTMWLG